MENGVVDTDVVVVWDAITAWIEPTGRGHLTLNGLSETLYDGSTRTLEAAVGLGFHPEFVGAYTRETEGWAWADTEQSPPKESFEGIRANPSSCPLCEGRGRYDRTVRGNKFGTLMVVRDGKCFCSFLLKWDREWATAMRRRARFIDVKLTTLEPSPESWLPLERQREIIEVLRRHPGDSYLLQGAAGTGKSHYLTALHRHALVEDVLHRWKSGSIDPGVWRVTTSELLDEHEAWSRRSDEFPAKLPSLTVGKIRVAAEQGRKPRLFLDEIDKIAATDHKTRTLFGLIDAVYEAGGQVVATSNASLHELEQTWAKFSDRAVAVLRRVGAGEGAHTITFVRG